MLKKMMSTSAHSLYYRSPVFVQHAFTSAYGFKKRRERYNDYYHEAFRRYVTEDSGGREPLIRLMHHLKDNIVAYRDIDVDEETIMESYLALPMTEKEDLRRELDDRSHKEGKLHVSRTGGTTGYNLAVFESEEDWALRMAYLDYIKYRQGIEPFSKRASFTGREITPAVHRNKLWRYNLAMNQALYASHHMTPENVEHVYENMKRFRPVSIDGLPSSIHMVAKYMLSNGLRADWDVKAVFPTAEILLPYAKRDIEAAFDTVVIDQYASSEGAPFLYGNTDEGYTIGHETGLFEFERRGEHRYEMIVTSFLNYATPLVRYRIGDEVEIHSDREYLNSYEDDIIIRRIYGRRMDYLIAQDGRKVMNIILAWIVDGFEEKVVQCQIVQKEKEEFQVNMVVEDDYDEHADELVIRGRLERQLGPDNRYVFNYMDFIPKEKNGKVRFIINELEQKAGAGSTAEFG
ncbi:hypothetical protein WN59_09910 [Salinicoccus sediminis]|uniref:Coenzyme F390 synthetase n=1 Tax=Salinicoccus sediminis TaxID=1432562 RepID=A0A0M2SI13_9STAP|nr:hypothetical protein [Salinicoccus sediminis]KKK33913.1 hypothetical protein WN59_09910 [Salinicoccus sediminis]